MRPWSREEMQRIGDWVVDLVADHLSTLPAEPAFRPVPPERAQAFLSTPPPQDPVPPDDILRLFQDTIEPYPFGNGRRQEQRRQRQRQDCGLLQRPSLPR